MAKSPNYTILVESTEVNISERVNSMDYEDVIEGDDLITFKLGGFLIEDADEDYLDVGTIWLFNFGFIGGKQSTKRRCMITQSDFDYNKARADVTVIARDLGYTTKRATSNLVYSDKTASDIARDIANKFGFGTDIEDTTKVYPTASLGNKNFMQFLKDLAVREGASPEDGKGNVEVYVRGNVLTFKRRDLSTDAKRLYEYGNGNNGITDLSITYEDSGTTSTTGTQSSGIDTETGLAFNAKVTSEDNKETSTGAKDVVFSVSGVLQTPILSEEEISGKNLPVPASNEEEAKDRITGSHKDAKVRAMKLTLTVELDPTIEAGDIITLSGVAQKHVGNWRLEKVNHIVNESGGITKMEGVRNGAKKTSTVNDEDNTGDVNSSTGNVDGEVDKDLDRVVFSNDGRKLN